MTAPKDEGVPGHRFLRLVEVMATLRRECPWDREQTHESLAPYLLQEAYETLETIEERDFAQLHEELGDVLLQVVFHSVVASERAEDDPARFSVDDVADALQGDRPGSGAVGDGERGLLGHWGTILHVCAPPGFPRGREKSSARTRVQWFRNSGRRTGNPGWEPPIADSRVVACGAWRVVGQRSIPRKRLSDDNTDTPHGPSGRRPRRSCEPERRCGCADT